MKTKPPHIDEYLRVRLQKKLAGGQGPLQVALQFTLANNGMLAIMGPSGIGKTSILRMIAGLMKPDSGSVYLDGVCWFDLSQRINLPPQKRGVGFVFQDYGLFPNMTILQNLKFAAGAPSSNRLIPEVLSMMKLEDLAHQRPHTLSGGQRQRVALARTIVQQPRLLLLDEPLAALDAPTRRRLQEDLRSLHSRFGFTTILVSHDKQEVVRLADKVMIFNTDGKVERQGDPAIIFSKSIADKLTGELIRISSDQQEMFVLTDDGVWKLPYRNSLQIGDQVSLRDYL